MLLLILAPPARGICCDLSAKTVVLWTSFVFYRSSYLANPARLMRIWMLLLSLGLASAVSAQTIDIDPAQVPDAVRKAFRDRHSTDRVVEWQTTPGDANKLYVMTFQEDDRLVQHWYNPDGEKVATAELEPLDGVNPELVEVVKRNHPDYPRLVQAVRVYRLKPYQKMYFFTLKKPFEEVTFAYEDTGIPIETAELTGLEHAMRYWQAYWRTENPPQ